MSLIPFFTIFMNYGTNMRDESPELPRAPNSMFYLVAICYFLYRMLDEMDGK